ncbi:MAG: hypothetical protein GXZ08_09580 [Tissierellia bacterium]|nr:hypothetical protein [Tissierellia bacterium]
MKFKVYAKIKRSLLLFLVFVFTIGSFPIVSKADSSLFTDVPNDHWASEHIYKLKELNITSGVGDNQFGIGQTLTRAEFVTFLCKLMKWEIIENSESIFSDNSDSSEWFFPYINTAQKHNVITDSDDVFRPRDAITRREMAVMMINAIGYNELARDLNSDKSYFDDVTEDIGFINLAKDFGLINGIDERNYGPNNTAKREEVAAILARMNNNISMEIEHKNAFYAIRSSNQKQSINHFDSISFGWSRYEFEDGNLILNTSASNNNEYNTPEGYEVIISLSSNKDKLLMMASSNEDSAKILSDSNLRRKAAELAAEFSGNFDGVVVDFEGLKGNDLKVGLNEYLEILRANIGNKKIYVAVHPRGREDRVYFDAYDYKTIGRIADKVILMAHDYNAKSLTEAEMNQGVIDTPISPIKDVYYAIKAITDPNSGVEDHNKILLQISFVSAQWKTRDGKVLNQKPFTPNYDAIMGRMNQSAELDYSKKYENPFIKFYDADDDTNNIIWYEDSRSVAAKIELAKLLNIKGISVWRLGIIPDGSSHIHMDVLSKLENY